MYKLNLTETKFLITLAALKSMESTILEGGFRLHEADRKELQELIQCMSDAWEIIGPKGKRLNASHPNRS